MTCKYLIFANSADETSYKCNADARVISTRKSNMQVYDEDGRWHLANVKYYDGSAWETKAGLNYYTGDSSQGDNGWFIAGSS